MLQSILKLPFLLIWKIVKSSFSAIGRIFWVFKLIFSRTFGIVAGVIFGILGGFGKVGWKKRK